MSFLNLSTKLRELEDKLDKSEVDDCGCLSENIGDQGLESLRLWHFPILCILLCSIGYFFWGMFALTHETLFFHLTGYIVKIGEELGCWWASESNSVTLKGEHIILQSTYANALLDRIQNEMVSDSDCDCEKQNMDDVEVIKWRFPVICTLLLPLYFFIFFLSGITHINLLVHLTLTLKSIAKELGCWWD